jgi:4-hydroxy-tetrahydrodipicolinate synthase
VVFPGVASEDVHLSAEERGGCLAAVVAAVAGRVPVVAGINSALPEEMVKLAAEARGIGAGAIMAMAIPAMGGEAARWFGRIAEATDGLPIILQNQSAPRGANLSAAEMLQVARQVPAIRYIKEETVPSGPRVSELVEGRGPNIDGVIGGGGARYLFEELERGVIATMPAIELLELHVAIYRAYDRGDRALAMALYERSVPLLLIQAPYRMRLTKLILKHRGLIETEIVREPLPEMDQVLRRLTIELYERLDEHLREEPAVSRPQGSLAPIDL